MKIGDITKVLINTSFPRMETILRLVAIGVWFVTALGRGVWYLLDSPASTAPISHLFAGFILGWCFWKTAEIVPDLWALFKLPPKAPPQGP